MHIINSYNNYKIESSFLGLTPNNIFHFLYLYFLTDTYTY